MEIQQLRYFVAVAEAGGFTRAASRSHVSQPSLSQQIANLERELGQPLFDRLGRGVALTQAGERLLSRARDILAAVESAGEEIRATGQTVGGRLRVGSVSTVAQFALPGILRGFLTEHSNVDLTIHEGRTKALAQSVANGEVDLAVVSREVNEPRLTFEVLQRETFRLALPAAHELASRKRLRATDLRACRFVLLQPVPEVDTLIEDFCCGQGFEPTIVCRGEQLATVQAMVGAGLGLAFVPQMAAEADVSPERIYRDLTGEKPKRTIGLLTPRQRHQSPAVRAFINRLRTGFQNRCQTK